MVSLPGALQTALQHHQAGRLQEAEALYRQILQIQPAHPDAIHLLGLIAHQIGQHQVAVDYISRAITLNPNAAEFHSSLGLAYRALGKQEEAVAHYWQALTLKPDFADAHSNLGNALWDQGKLEEAVAQYRRALALKPDFAEAHNNLGNALRDQGKVAEAVVQYRQALALKPDYADAHYKLGFALQTQGKLEEAVAQYRRALALKPALAEAVLNLGLVLQTQGKLEEAEAHYRQALALKPDNAEAHNNLGAALIGQDKVDEAEAHCRRALALKPDFLEAYVNLGVALKKQGKFEEEGDCYKQALALRPNHAGFKIKLATTLPVILRSSQEIPAIRKTFEENLDSLMESGIALQDPTAEVGQTSFYLAYHGLNDRDLQVKIARLYERACPALLYSAPHCVARPQSIRGGKIKIGFISKYLYHHSIGIVFRGILAHLSRTQLSVCALFVPPVKNDEYFTFIREHVDKAIVLPATLEAARERIAKEELDILCYLDLGMEPMTYFLAFSRLAPVQCVLPGHPVTTGIGAIDYFISSEHLEPADAEAHYSERLVRLKHVPTYFYRPTITGPLKSKEDFGLDGGKTIYLCPQTLFKVHPDFDQFLADILLADQRALVVFVDSNVKHWSGLLRSRFASTIPEMFDRIKFIPRLDIQGFLQLLAVADVILDTPHFSGGSTSYMALAMGTPVITLRGRFMKDRATYACYKQMGVMDCVALSRKEYVRRAVRMGTDPAFREQVKKKILANNHVLYENLDVVREFERFLLQAIK